MRATFLPTSAPHPRRSAFRAWPWMLALAALAMPRGSGAALPASLALKLDPALAGAANSEAEVLVWVEMSDRGPGDLASRLAAAQAHLTVRARARRLRARVTPLVDERDIPVAPEYLAALGAQGFQPYAVSRWFNRAAVRIRGTQLAQLADLPFVARLAKVPRMIRSRDPEPAEESGQVLPRPLPHQAPGSSLPGPLGARASESQRSASEPAPNNPGQMTAALAQIGVPALHDSLYAGAGVLICVLDEGFNYHDRHEALRDRVVAPGRSRDFVEGDTTVTDTTSIAFTHGTWVLGCLAAYKPGTYIGPAWRAELALARTENRATETPSEMLNWALAAEWADSLGADILTSSVGYTTFDPPFPGYVYGDMDGHTTDITRAAEIAASKGMLVVNSVGNEGNKLWHYLVAPADADGDSLIAVGAVNLLGTPAAFSSFGPSADGRIKPDLAALGVSVPLVSATGNPQGYESNNGTSFSAPLVAGLAACLMQARPAWTPRDVIRALRASGSRVNQPDNRVGFGIPNGGLARFWTAGGGGIPPGIPVAGSVRLLGPNPLRAGEAALRVRFAAGGVEGGANRARVNVVDAQGRAVRKLWSGSLARGEVVDVFWGGESDAEGRVPPGLYFIALEAGGDVVVARVLVLQ